MKRFKKLGVALLSATLLLIPYMTSINAQDNPYDTWRYQDFMEFFRKSSTL